MNKNRILYQSDGDVKYNWDELPKTDKDCAVLLLDATFKDVVIINTSGLDEEETESLIQDILSKLPYKDCKVANKIGNTYFCSYE